MKCSICHKELHLSVFPKVVGKYNEIIVTLIGFPYLECSDPTHPRPYASKKFSKYLRDYFFDGEQVPIARSGIFTFSKLRCFKCKNKLNNSSSEIRNLKAIIYMPGLTNFEAEFTGPTITCQFCGEIQLDQHGSLSSDLADSVLEAFKKMNLKT